MARYRAMSMQPECELAIDEIVNEAIVSGRKSYPVSIELDYLEDYSEMLKEKIGDEFYAMMDKLNFKYMGYEIFRKWFIDGRLFYQVLIDVKNPQKGILELRPIDPFKIKKIQRDKKTDEETAQIGQIKSKSINNTMTIICFLKLVFSILRVKEMKECHQDFT